MRLIVNTATVPAYVAVVDQAESVIELLPSDQKPEHTLLPAIENILASRQADLADVRGIVVAVQAGTFSGVRAGVVTVNALQYALGIPLGTFIPDASALPKQQLLGLDQVPLSPEPVVAEYTGLPNITQAKH